MSISLKAKDKNNSPLPIALPPASAPGSISIKSFTSLSDRPVTEEKFPLSGVFLNVLGWYLTNSSASESAILSII